MPVTGSATMPRKLDPLPDPVEELRPLGSRQHAFWVLQQLLPETPVSNLVVGLRTTRELRWWPLHAALTHLVARHPALRTRVPVLAGVPVRHVSAADDVRPVVEVVSATEDDLMRTLAEHAWRPFDLARDLPVRLVLCGVDGDGGALLLVAHHIATDGGSLATLVEELAALYDAFAAGGEVPDRLRGEVPPAGADEPSAEDLAYWAERLEGVDVADAFLPWARPAAIPPTFAGRTSVRPLSAPAGRAVASLRRELGTTENLVLLTAWCLTLARHGAGDDLVVGVPVSRRGADSSAGVGFHVSTLPLRVRLDPEAGFRAAARSVRDVFLGGVQHASASVEEVLAATGHASSDWRVPVFRYLFNYRPWDEGAVELDGERPTPLDVLREDSRLDISLVVVAGQDPPLLLVNFSTELFEDHEVLGMLRRMESLLESAAAAPDSAVRDLDVATPDERAAVAAANDTAAPEAVRETVPVRFAAQVAAAPEAVAVVADGVETSYADLDAEAGAVARTLRSRGIGRGDVVALALPRGKALVAAVLGAWRVGAAYLPLDPDQPPRRVAVQVADARAALLVVTDAGSPAVPGPTPMLAWEELLAPCAAATPEGEEPVGEDPDRPAYVVYTSGSTGTPRGVVVTHENLANVVGDFAVRLGVGAKDGVLWSTTTAFDISALELFLPLTTGGRLVVADTATVGAPDQLLDLVRSADVSVVQATPTYWQLVVAQDAATALGGRTVVCGGEPLTASLARDLLATGCRLVNAYGPTETTIWSTAAEISDGVEDPVPIGGPIANTTLSVVDRHGAETPAGVLGELCIGGLGVASGYLGHPDLTAERFRTSTAGGRTYRTGDLARRRQDGSVELFGRADRQVKVRGHRLELPEVEAALREHDEVLDAVVVLCGETGVRAELRAFVRPVPGADADLSDRVWPHLLERLPTYAMPSRLVVLPSFPTTANGKVDHGALRAHDVERAPAGRPSTVDGPDRDPALTARLLEVFREVLGQPALADHDHFFLNGGHSVLAVGLAGVVRDRLGLALGVRGVFDHPSARALSAHLADGSTT